MLKIWIQRFHIFNVFPWYIIITEALAYILTSTLRNIKLNFVLGVTLERQKNYESHGLPKKVPEKHQMQNCAAKYVGGFTNINKQVNSAEFWRHTNSRTRQLRKKFERSKRLETTYPRCKFDGIQKWINNHFTQENFVSYIYQSLLIYHHTHTYIHTNTNT